MELKTYWHIVMRRWWIIAILVAVVFVASLVLAPRPTTSYTAAMKFTVGLVRENQPSVAPLNYDPAYYSWLISEYLADDFAVVVKSSLFAEDVSKCAGQGVSAGAIQGAATTAKEHRVLSVQFSSANEQQATAIAHCVAKVLREDNAKYFKQLNTYNAAIQLIDGPTITTTTAGVRERIDLPIRLLLAVIAGIALAFLIDYLDDSVRSARELEQMGIAVLGEIPQSGRGIRVYWPKKSQDKFKT